ncbi:hypothetical protein HYX04_04555 [Candidatus Woesearchaeota archaeon]|nr:hypothetical protein [Candidatus Woesearchaeota archaeon]
MDGLQRLQFAQGIIKKIIIFISQISSYRKEKEELLRKLMSEENTIEKEKISEVITEVATLITRRESQQTALERDLAAQLERFNEWADEVGLRIKRFNITRIKHREYILGELSADLDIAVLETTRFMEERGG